MINKLMPVSFRFHAFFHSRASRDSFDWLLNSSQSHRSQKAFFFFFSLETIINYPVGIFHFNEMYNRLVTHTSAYL